METITPSAVVLLSGGLDSTTVLAYAINQGFNVYVLTVNYGQKNQFELSRAKEISKYYQANEHKILNVHLNELGGSSLTTSEIVEKGRSLEQIGLGIPKTYVPVRNTIFLSLALAWAETLDIPNIFIGVNAVDTSGYPDCRPEFISAFTNLANLATKMSTEGGKKIKIHAPLQNLSKAEIIALGTSLDVNYSMTISCYDPLPSAQSCGLCDACILRKKGFAEANLIDPLTYA